MLKSGSSHNSMEITDFLFSRLQLSSHVHHSTEKTRSSPTLSQTRSRSHLNDLGVVSSHSIVENSLPIPVGDVHSRMALQQLQQALHVPLAARQVQWGAAILAVRAVHTAAREDSV